LLRALEKKYQIFLENTREAILVLQDGNSRLINSRILEISGYSKKELASLGFLQLIHPEDKERVSFHLKNANKAETSGFFHCRIIRKDGGIRWLENRLASVQWDGKAALVNYMADISERKKAEEEMSRSLEPFRAVLQAMEKIVWGVNREYTAPGK
jgi:PAS domain S-box-containing protein